MAYRNGKRYKKGVCLGRTPFFFSACRFNQIGTKLDAHKHLMMEHGNKNGNTQNPGGG